MKHHGSCADYTPLRNRELLLAFRREMAVAPFIRRLEICRKVADSPASRFWVSEERAAAVISSMLAGRRLPKMSHNKREMFTEIYWRYISMRDLRPRESLFSLISEIVHQPAPKFYLTPLTVGEIIYRIRNGWYDRPPSPSPPSTLSPASISSRHQ